LVIVTNPLKTPPATLLWSSAAFCPAGVLGAAMAPVLAIIIVQNAKRTVNAVIRNFVLI
jgi:hypothetical protein